MAARRRIDERNPKVIHRDFILFSQKKERNDYWIRGGVSRSWKLYRSSTLAPILFRHYVLRGNVRLIRVPIPSQTKKRELTEFSAQILGSAHAHRKHKDRCPITASIYHFKCNYEYWSRSIILPCRNILFI